MAYLNMRMGLVKGMTADRDNNTWQTVTFDPAMNDSKDHIAFAQVQSYNGAQTPGLRIRNVTHEGFEMRMDEVISSGETADGTHAAEDVSWIAYEIDPSE